MNNSEIARLLEEYALFLELHGENSFKVSAYRKAARVLKGLDTEIADYLKQGKELTDIKGIGKAIAEHILQIIRENEFEALNQIKKRTPVFLVELTKIPGIGPKKARQLFFELGIKSLGELEYACYENRLKLLKGFGEKTQQKILKGLEFYKKHKDKLLYPEAAKIVDEFSVSVAKNFYAVGELRRKCEIIGKIELLMLEEGLQSFVKKFGGFEIGNNRVKFDFAGYEIHIIFSDKNRFATDFFELTGSKNHVSKIKDIYEKKRIKYGNFSTEREIYEKIGVPFVPPELREGLYEFSLFDGENELIAIEDIKGVLHIHTVYSDGSMSLEDVVNEGVRRNLEYVGISDHSKSSYIANGLNEDRVFEQFKEIDNLQERFDNIRILKGIECDILQDGTLDFSDDVLSLFDFVIASVHSHFNLNKTDMTKRLLKAVENPNVDMLAHPTGRLLLSRDGYEFDEEVVYKACAENGVVVELNANPHRLDIDWRKMEYVHKFGLKVSINPDAHHIDGFDDLEYGVNIARKGCLKKHQIFNAFPFESLFKK